MASPAKKIAELSPTEVIREMMRQSIAGFGAKHPAAAIVAFNRDLREHETPELLRALVGEHVLSAKTRDLFNAVRAEMAPKPTPATVEPVKPSDAGGHLATAGDSDHASRAASAAPRAFVRQTSARDVIASMSLARKIGNRALGEWAVGDLRRHVTLNRIDNAIAEAAMDGLADTVIIGDAWRGRDEEFAALCRAAEQKALTAA